MKTSELIATITLVSVITIFLALKSNKEKESSWKGELIKKKTIYDEDQSPSAYKLIFRKEDGKKTRVGVSEAMYNQAQVGERYEKVKGDYIPKKIS